MVDLLPVAIALLGLANCLLWLVVRRLHRRLDAMTDVAAAALEELDHG